MRRTLFYLSVALLAFGIGLSLAVKLHWLESDNIILYGVPPVKDEIVYACPLSSEKREGKNKCDNPYLSAVWDHLQKDADYQELFDGKNVISNCSEVFIISSVIDLNNDGDTEVVVSDNGWLNGVFNQSFWIVRRTGETYSIILAAKNLEYIEQSKFTNGFLNLVLSFKVSLEEYNKSLLEFNGKSYKPTKCWNEVIAARNDNGQIYKLKKARIIPIKCDAFTDYLIK